MLLLNEYHEDISKLHVNMMQRRSYYVPFIDANEAIAGEGAEEPAAFWK